MTKNPIMVAGLVIVGVVLLVALAGPLIVPYSPETAGPDVEMAPPALGDVPG